jgi:hypothetical protein
MALRYNPVAERSWIRDRTHDTPFLLKLASSAIALPAILYITGYIVVSAAEERIGLQPLMGDSLKFQYLYVGALACGFVVGIIGMSSLVFQAIEQRYLKHSTPIKEMRSSAKISMFLVAAGLFVQISFVPRGLFRAWPATLLNIFILLWLAVSFVVRLRPDPRLRKWLVRSILAIALVFFFSELNLVYAFVSPPPPPDRLMGIAIKFLPFTQAIFVERLLFRLLMQESRTSLSAGERFEWNFLSLALSVFFFFTTILSFAAVYSTHIPAARNGTDYRAAPACILWLRAPGSFFSSSEIVDPEQPRKTVAMVMILETSDAYYCAPDPLNFRGEWGKLNGDRPRKIWEFRRDTVDAVESLSDWPKPDLRSRRFVLFKQTECCDDPDLPESEIQTTILAPGTRYALIRIDKNLSLIWTEDGVRGWIRASDMLPGSAPKTTPQQ